MIYGTSLLDYYRKKEDEYGNIKFERVKEEDIKIYGHTLEEVIKIMQGLDTERKFNILMTMDNIQKYIDLI